MPSPVLVTSLADARGPDRLQVRHALLVPARQVLVLLSSQLQRTMNTTTILPSLSTWTHGVVGRHSQNRRAPSYRQVSRSARLRPARPGCPGRSPLQVTLASPGSRCHVISPFVPTKGRAATLSMTLFCFVPKVCLLRNMQWLRQKRLGDSKTRRDGRGRRGRSAVFNRPFSMAIDARGGLLLTEEGRADTLQGEVEAVLVSWRRRSHKTKKHVFTGPTVMNIE